MWSGGPLGPDPTKGRGRANSEPRNVATPEGGRPPNPMKIFCTENLKQRIFMLLLKNKILVLCLGLFALAFQSEVTPDKDQLLMRMILQHLQNFHFAPMPIDDDFSSKVFDLYLKRLDGEKRFFLASDVSGFEKFRKELDDEVRKGAYGFFEASEAVFEQRLAFVKEEVFKLLDQPFDLNGGEEIETDSDKINYVSDLTELKLRWRRTLQYQIVSRVYTALEVQEKAAEKSDTFKVKTVAELEADARAKIRKSYETWFASLEKQDRHARFGNYANVFASVHEPHSGYFPPLEKENFNIRMAGKLEGIGAQLIEEDGFIKVTRVVPGSASWRQGELKEGDLIIKVGQAEEPAVDVVDMKMDDVLPMIRGKKGTEVRLTVKRQDGTIKVIPIIRDVVVFEESFAKSAIIQHKKTKAKIGLIDLRSFYADFNDPRGRRCARDVRAELIKLKEEKVQGVILDLRFNGGGSLSDVVEMTGFFIDKGPIVQVKGRNDEQPQILPDNNPEVLYGGPLVILVNVYSASASEILAAALQDYGRAVIIGTEPSTFGKGTVQRFYDMDYMVGQKDRHLGPLGSIKVTIQKFYRINGGSTQLQGVKPDIVVPGAYKYLEMGEREEDFAMAWSEIEPAQYRSFNQIKLDRIKKRSDRRLKENPNLVLMEENALWYKSLREQSRYPLGLETYRQRKMAENKQAERFKPLEENIEDLEIRAVTSDLISMSRDTLRAESVKSWHKNLQKDHTLEEAIWVLDDLRK